MRCFERKTMTDIRDIFQHTASYAGKTVEARGWVRTLRDSKNIAFLELNDGTFFANLQVVLQAERLANFGEIARLPVGAAVGCRGVLVETPEARQAFELQAEAVWEEAGCDPAYPLQKKRHSLEYLRTIAHLRPRTNTFSAVFRVRSELAFAIHQFFHERGFVYVHTPIITSSDAEGAGQMFRVTTLDLEHLSEGQGGVDYGRDFFGKAANLSVSGQLEGECYAMAFQRIYTFGPTFRAENSNTPRHAAEFWMIEPEIAFADVFDDMDLAEAMVKYVIGHVLEKLPEEMAFFSRFVDKGLMERLENVLHSEFARITYTEAIDILEKADVAFQFPVHWGIDLQSEHERYLTEKVFRKPVFVTGYPKEIKAFYMRLNDDGKTVAAMDLLVPGVGEMIGGSQREERLDLLERRMAELGMDQDAYWWYLDLRRYGGVKHAGFGLGFERMMLYLTGMANIRDVIPFPRVPRWAEF